MVDDDSALRDALWKMYLEHCIHVRHHETQRSSVAAVIMAICAALIGLATFDRALTLIDVPLLLFLLIIGVFGAIFSAKQWERASMHTERARAHRNRVDSLLGGHARIVWTIKQEADLIHNRDFPRLYNLRLHRFWIGLYLLVAALAVVLIFVAVLSPIQQF
jgi:hypothetical protein